jgi:hypothetical protein
VRTRYLGIDLRVGSYALDNTPIRGALSNGMETYNYYVVPIDDDTDAMRARLWYFTDQRYTRAIEQLIARQNQRQSEGGRDRQARRLFASQGRDL